MSASSVTIGGKPLGKWRASWLLFKESVRFLKADSEMVFIPVVTSLASLFLIALLCIITFFVTWGGSFEVLSAWFETFSEQEESVPLPFYLFLFCLYVISAFTLALSQAGIAHIVYTRVHGGDATLKQGLTTAFSHWFSLLLWSLITSTVGVALQMIAERSKIVGNIVIALLGTAWAVLTYFVVPAMVIDKKSAFASIGHSASVFKKTWGETLVSNISIAIVFIFINLAIIAGAIGLVVLAFVADLWALVLVAIVLAVISLFVSALVQSTLNGVLKTLLYVYASEGIVPSNFNQELLEKMLSKNGTVEVTTSETSTQNIVTH